MSDKITDPKRGIYVPPELARLQLAAYLLGHEGPVQALPLDNHSPEQQDEKRSHKEDCPMPDTPLRPHPVNFQSEAYQPPRDCDPWRREGSAFSRPSAPAALAGVIVWALLGSAAGVLLCLAGLLIYWWLS